VEQRATQSAAAWVAGSTRRGRERDEAGLTLIEVVTAISLLALVMVLTVGPTMTGFATLRRAKIIDVAEAVAEGRIEQARQLKFDQVGTVGGSPAGLLLTNEVLEV
jgi:type II secretory pathway pseudopilin PulG